MITRGCQKAKRSESPDIVLFGNMQNKGGGPRVFLSNIKEWVRCGLKVEVLGYRDATPFLADEMPDTVRFHHLGTRRFFPTLVALWWFALTKKPRVILGSSHLTNRILCRVARLPGHGAQVWLTVHQDIVHSGKRTQRKKDKKLNEVRAQYPVADGVVAVSRGVAMGLVEKVGLPRDKVHTVYNAVLDDSVVERAKEDVEHPWFSDNGYIPVVISVGRLAEQKDFPTLIRAVSEVQKTLPCRLIILGEGKDRPELESLARELGIVESVDMPGFVDNPYAWLAQSSVFVLSSRWEGFGNVVAEALGVGVPVVATDCPSGPSEILAGGKYGTLVRVGDVRAIAAAIIDVLQGHGAQYSVDEAAEAFWAKGTARQYLALFGLDCKSAQKPGY